MFKIINNQKGVIIVFFTLSLLLICGSLAMIIDMGHIYYQKTLLQNAVDAATLAAAKNTTINHGEVVNATINIADKNGIHSNELTITHPYENNIYKVKIRAEKTVTTFFLPILGLPNTLTLSAQAIGGACEYFPYTIFTDGDIYINTSLVIHGNIHANGDVDLHSKDITVKGTVEAHEEIEERDSVTEGLFAHGPHRNMVQFNLDDYREKATVFYNDDLIIHSHYALPTNEIIFVDGDVKIQSLVAGTGKIIATGNIEFVGNGINFGTLNDDVSFFAGESITFKGTNSRYSGLFYAPKVDIDIACSKSTFHCKFCSNSFKLVGSNNVIQPIVDSPENRYPALIE